MCLPSWSPTTGAIETGPYQDDWGPGTGDVSRADCSTDYDCSSDRAAFAREPGPLGGVLANRLRSTSSCAVSFKQKSKNRFRRRLSQGRTLTY